MKAIEDLSTEKVKTKIIHSGTGAITDSDVLLATASGAIIVGFNVTASSNARKPRTFVSNTHLNCSGVFSDTRLSAITPAPCTTAAIGPH